MRSDLEEITPGLFVRKDTPKKVQLTDSFLRRIVGGSESTVFNKTMDKIAKQNGSDKASSGEAGR